MLNINRDGFVTASQLEKVLEGMAEPIIESMGRLSQRILDQEREIAALRREVETERRLRLSMSGRR